MIEGVDYSRGGFPGSGALGAAGKAFAVRYVVGDLSPEGRGITAAEYAELTTGGIEVVAVWEGESSRMLAGGSAGQQDAHDAQMHLLAAGLPPTIPVYFACDFDATPGDQVAIDDYLRGAATILGIARVGLYAGYWPLMRAQANKTASWFWQTTAWSGENVLAGIHLEQYAYNAWIGGVNCDLVRAQQADYGQASAFLAPPPAVTPPTTYAAPELPEWWARSLAQSHPSDAKVGDVTWHAIRRRVEAIDGTYRYSRPDIKSPRSGPPVATREKVAIERWFTDAAGKTWLVEATGSFLFAGRFTPKINIRNR